MVFLCKDRATTEIYTYGHTLSLHDALPICWRKDPAAPLRGLAMGLSPRARAASFRRSNASFGITTSPRTSSTRGASPRRRRGMLRSEEHTSELQSLMRISYAVFCLKKKTNTLSVTIHIIISPYLSHA